MRTLTPPLRQSLLLITAISVVGLLIARQIGLTGLNQREVHQYNAFTFLYYEHEPVFFGLFIALSVLGYLLFCHIPARHSPLVPLDPASAPESKYAVAQALPSWYVLSPGWVLSGYSTVILPALMSSWLTTKLRYLPLGTSMLTSI